MPEVKQLPVIKRLPVQLANQIAAGEVIERPASVLKELIENSLDAAATRLDIELVNGGMDHIVVTDNGHGIQASELALAISRHATSKIESVQDLVQLNSLGFRGEALASICSVSEWEMISKPASAKQASKMSHLMPDQSVEINHTTGTRVSVRNLFHNTPARRKFLRAERTEYRHCEDVIKRLALTSFDVAYYVKHNGRVTMRLPAVNDDIGRSRRVAQVCGEAFIKQSMAIDYPRKDMRLWGWVSQPEYSRQSADLQFFYINGRIIRDRVITHAIRSAYQDVLPPGRHPAYVLHLEVEPSCVDVNVHPTKHEVRFRESRVVHDFVSHSIRDALQQGLPGYYHQDSLTASVPLQTVTGHASAHADLVNEQTGRYQLQTKTLFGRILTLVHKRFVVTQQHECMYLVDLQKATALWVSRQWQDAVSNHKIKSLPLLLPQRLELSPAEVPVYRQHQDVFQKYGFDLSLLSDHELLIRRIPSSTQPYDSVELIRRLLSYREPEEFFESDLAEQLRQLVPDHTGLDLDLLLGTVASSECYAACWREISSSDLSALVEKPR